MGIPVKWDWPYAGLLLGYNTDTDLIAWRPGQIPERDLAWRVSLEYFGRMSSSFIQCYSDARKTCIDAPKSTCSPANALDDTLLSSCKNPEELQQAPGQISVYGSR